MLKYSKNCEGAEDLQEALTSIMGILKAVNDSMHQIAITGYDVSSHAFKRYLQKWKENVISTAKTLEVFVLKFQLWSWSVYT